MSDEIHCEHYNGLLGGYCAMCAALLVAENKDLTKQMSWISVDERLPGDDGNYLVTDGTAWSELVFFDTDRGWNEFDPIVTHWMPIPPLPQEKPDE